MKIWVWHTLNRTSSIWKTAIAAGLAWYIATLTGTDRPYFAPLAAILCLQVTVAESVWKGYQRLLGITVGVILAEFMTQTWGVHAWSIALLVFIGTGLASLFRFGDQAVPQVGVSAMMVMTVGGGHYAYALDRVGDTIIGAVVSIIVNMFVFPPDFSSEAVKAVQTAAAELATHYDEIADCLQTGMRANQVAQIRMRTHAYLERLHRTQSWLDKAQTARKYSPLLQRRKSSLGLCSHAVIRLRQGYAHAAGMLRTCYDWQNNGTFGEAERCRWANVLQKFAEAIRTWGTDPVYWVGSDAAHRLSEPPAYLADLQPPATSGQYSWPLYTDALQFATDFLLFAPQSTHADNQRATDPVVECIE